MNFRPCQGLKGSTSGYTTLQILLGVTLDDRGICLCRIQIREKDIAYDHQSIYHGSIDRPDAGSGPLHSVFPHAHPARKPVSRPCE